MDDRSRIERRLADPTPLPPAELADLALDALDQDLAELIIARVEAAIAEGAESPRLYQILGLARRQLLDGAKAVLAFQQAVARAPLDPLIVHGLARATWEAGLPAVDLYDAALRVAPSDAQLLAGRSAALHAEGRGEEALAALRTLLDQHPGWYDGHATFARLASAARASQDGTDTVRAALVAYPADPTLWRILHQQLLEGRRYSEAAEAARQAEAALGDDPEWRRTEAIALSQMGDAAAAQQLFDFLPYTNVAAALVHPIRNLIRLGRFDEALAMAERSFDPAEEAVLWPYRGLLWRILGDARWEWLEGDDRLVRGYDLGFSPQQMGDLAALLRDIHGGSGEMLDQSVRGGSQTDGNLLARAQPEIVRLKSVLMDAVRMHIDQLPPPVPGHPMLIERRAPVRIAGSWSVRLTDAGFHVDHVHPHGWLSSAFYVTLPPARGKEGWLAFGEARDLLPELDGFAEIKPEIGRLILFPATMWHGTRPFPAGERMTVAFDVARPAQ